MRNWITGLFLIYASVGWGGKNSAFEYEIPPAPAPFVVDLDNDFFTADQHFDHEKIIRLSNRPFANGEEMKRVLIENWNRRVPKTGRVWVVGDFAGHIETLLEVFPKLNGKKYLILGNHDLPHPNNQLVTNDKNRAKWLARYQKVGWAGIYLNAVLQVPGVGHVNVCHYPYHAGPRPPGCERLVVRGRLYDDGNILLCGHVHNAWSISGRMVNVGVDVQDYAPRSLRELIENYRIGSTPSELPLAEMRF